MTLSLVALAVLTAAPAPAAADSRSEEAVRESVLRLAAGDVPGSLTQAQAAVAADPRSTKALQQLARAAGAALDFPAAEQAAARAMEIDGPTPALLCLRSEARAGNGDYAGALADAEQAASINPASAKSVMRRAAAKEGLGRPAEESLADYRRAAELDPAYAPMRDEALLRLAPARRPRGGLAGLALLAVSGAAGWAWARLRRAPEPEACVPAARLVLPGTGRLEPRQALRALASAAAQAEGPEDSFVLAQDLYERLTGRRPAPGGGAAELPTAMDAFFERALNCDPQRRFRSGVELLGAFRSIVEPPID
ncbi:MAG TPA: hypothetical protein DCZ01_12105 [Elusimicrobia bacterium]|nr:MAG: hypothetical protein A2X37_01115 [Elusimicrobia bacterium GWA2_66_18]OGR70460.1 MAG: hypothetical protein A2X40_09225 [Elusimicrobia bacterium GWC2_65_9]HAZ09233.1 hypothetical protein [Elusimicrobiota bacterium]